jgi:3-oxoacyl-[acyl-carrier protein] reductase
MGTLRGRNAFVTGTSQGIGAAIADVLIQADCNVCMHYFSSEKEPGKLQKAAEMKNIKALCLQADLTREEEVVKCVKDAVDFFGSFDILVNNAGSLVRRNYLAEITPEYWQTVIDINLTTMMLVTRELLPFLNQKDGSSIVNVSSLAGRAGGHPGSLVYSTCKGAVLTWTRSLSKELSSLNIRVNAVAPGICHENHCIHSPGTFRKSLRRCPCRCLPCFGIRWFHHR